MLLRLRLSNRKHPILHNLYLSRTKLSRESGAVTAAFSELACLSTWGCSHYDLAWWDTKHACTHAHTVVAEHDVINTQSVEHLQIERQSSVSNHWVTTARGR